MSELHWFRDRLAEREAEEIHREISGSVDTLERQQALEDLRGSGEGVTSTVTPGRGRPFVPWARPPKRRKGYLDMVGSRQSRRKRRSKRTLVIVKG